MSDHIQGHFLVKNDVSIIYEWGRGKLYSALLNPLKYQVYRGFHTSVKFSFGL